MDNTPISVLITDDSALMRNLIGKIIEQADGLMVAGKAMNGRFALDKIDRLKPDIILLDLEMPEMNGIEFLKERKARGIEVPVIILSSLARRGAQITMEALSLGASDFIMKPSGSISQDIHVVGSQIVQTLLAYGSQYRRKSGNAPVVLEPGQISRKPEGNGLKLKAVIDSTDASLKDRPMRDREFIPPVPQAARRLPSAIDLVTIGISTGGPNALREVFSKIDPALPVPVVVVQHMPPGFTSEFAKSLNRISPLEVKEAEDGDLLQPGRVYIAPGDNHVEVEKRRLASVIKLSGAEPRNGHRPSADVLFASAARDFGNRTLGVIMTGMGRDGAKEIGTLYNLGAVTVGQNETSCVVYGMPRVAAEHGYIDHVAGLKDMADTISRLAKKPEY